MNTDTTAEAEKNLRKLSENPYPGRGLVLGRTKDGKYLVQVYWIMGRSENSRNRVFGVEGGRLFTEAADPAKVKDPKLIIYNAMDESRDPRCFVVSNGDQTDTLIQGFKTGVPFMHTLHKLEYEPDAPNYTPRISGFFWKGDGEIKDLTVLSLLRKSSFGVGCDRFFYNFTHFEPGYGFGLTTYRGDGNPLPSFEGEPLLLPINGSTTMTVGGIFWSALNEENRVSLSVKFIDGSGKSEISIINKYQKVG